MFLNHWYEEQMNNKSFKNIDPIDLYSQSFYHSFALYIGKVFPNFMRFGQNILNNF